MRSLWVAGGLFIIAAIIYLSLAAVAVEINVQEGDKIGHLLSYGALMAWWCQLYGAPGRRRWLAIGFIALGGALELAQGLTPSRTPELLDLAADSAGVLLGWLASPPRIPSLYARLSAAFPATPR
jgi:VanZ family protein